MEKYSREMNFSTWARTRNQICAILVSEANPYSKSRDDMSYPKAESLNSGKSGGGLVAASILIGPCERSGQNHKTPCCSMLG